MKFTLRRGNPSDMGQALALFQSAAEHLRDRGIDQWRYWLDPPKEEMEWVRDGFEKQEFFFIEGESSELLGMVRIQSEDIRYWGPQKDKAWYIHSLVIQKKWSGRQLGSHVLQHIEQNAIRNGQDYLRLDCLAKNTRLGSYYQNQGFVLVGKVELALSTCNLFEKRIGSTE